MTCVTPNDHIVYMSVIKCKYAFVLAENVDADAVYDEILGVIEQYYPTHNLVDSYEYGDEISAHIAIEELDGKTYYRICDETANKKKDYTNIGNYANSIMSQLDAKGLISKFYAPGQIGYEQDVYGYAPLSYPIESSELLEEYVEENNLDCTVEFTPYSNENPSWVDCDTYTLNFTEERTVEENFILAADIYKELGLTAHCLILESSTTTYGTDSLSSSITGENLLGDANGDTKLNARDCSFIARTIAASKISELPMEADFNKDGKVNIRDAAALAGYLVSLYDNNIHNPNV